MRYWYELLTLLSWPLLVWICFYLSVKAVRWVAGRHAPEMYDAQGTDAESDF